MHHTQVELKNELTKEVYLLRVLLAEALALFQRRGPKARVDWERLMPVVRDALARAEGEPSEESCWAVTRAANELRAVCASLRAAESECALPGAGSGHRSSSLRRADHFTPALAGAGRRPG
jgi:hypothetical protein